MTSISSACTLRISLPPDTTVRTVLLSARDSLLWQGIGLTVSVGNALLTSTPCKFISNTGTTSTYSTTGLSAWLTCDNLVGSKLFLTNPTYKMVILFEVMAFTQYNVQPFFQSVSGATSTVSNTILKFNNTEMNIQTGTDSTCYTSVTATTSSCSGNMDDPCYPYVWFMFEAVIPFSAFLAIP